MSPEFIGWVIILLAGIGAAFALGRATRGGEIDDERNTLANLRAEVEWLRAAYTAEAAARARAEKRTP